MNESELKKILDDIRPNLEFIKKDQWLRIFEKPPLKRHFPESRWEVYEEFLVPSPFKSDSVIEHQEIGIKDFIDRFCDLFLPKNSEIWLFLEHWLHHGITDKKEITAYMSAVNLKSINVRVPESKFSSYLNKTFEHFGMEYPPQERKKDKSDNGGLDKSSRLIQVFLLYTVDFVHEKIDTEAAQNKVIETRIQLTANSKEISTVINRVRDDIKELINDQCEDMKTSDITPSKVGKFHINIHCRYDDKNLLLSDILKNHYYDKRSNNPIMLLGKAGSGKTNCLKFLALQCIKGEVFNDLVPFYLEMREIKQNISSIEDLIKNKWKEQNINISEDDTNAILNSGNLLLLLDGLDEIDIEIKEKLNKKIDEFVERYRKSKVVISCRTTATDGGIKYTYIDTLDLDDDQVKDFACKFHNELKAKGESIAKGKTPESLILEINNNEKIHGLSKVLINLHLICTVYFMEGTLPEKRSKLYEKAFDISVCKWNRIDKKDNDFREFILFLAAETFNKTNKENSANNIFSEDFDNLLDDFVSDRQLNDEKRSVLEDQIIRRSGLFHTQSFYYHFEHLTWHEYFVSVDIVNKLIGSKTEEKKKLHYDYLFNNISQRKWYEVFLFVREILDTKGDEHLSEFLQQMEDYINNTSKFKNCSILQNILGKLLEASNFFDKIRKYDPKIYSESGVRGFIIEGVIDNYGNSLCAHILGDLPFDFILNGNLERMLSIVMKREPELEIYIRKDIYTRLDRFIEPQLNDHMPLVEFDKHGIKLLSVRLDDRSELHNSANEVDINPSYLDEAIGIAQQILEKLNDNEPSDDLTELKNHYKELSQKLTELKKDLLKIIEKGEEWHLSSEIHHWAKSLRMVMQDRYIGYDWQDNMKSKEWCIVKEYYNANRILSECMYLTDNNDTQKKKDKRRNLLLPFAELENRKNILPL